MEKYREGWNVFPPARQSLISVIVILVFSFPLFSLASGPDDICVLSDDNPMVTIDGCETGVPNARDSAGCTIWLRVMQCAKDVKKHSDFTRCVTTALDKLKKSGVITDKEKQKIQKCASKADYPCSKCNAVGVAKQGPGFGFETASDSLSLALATVYDAYITSPDPHTDMVVLGRERGEAMRYLQAHPEEAAAALIKEASKLNPLDQGGVMVVLHLMSRFESQAGIGFLFDRVVKPPPSNCTSGGMGEVACGIAFSLRMAAIGGLGHLCSLGSVTARARLLDLVGNADASVQRQAVAVFYESAGMSRWRAKRLMSERLPASKHYLLHEIY